MSALAPRLVDAMVASPVITYRGAAALLGVTQRSARLNVEKLVEQGMLKEVSGRQRSRVFIAPEIISLLDARAV